MPRPQVHSKSAFDRGRIGAAPLARTRVVWLMLAATWLSTGAAVTLGAEPVTSQNPVITEEPVVLRWQVFDPDHKPVAGAKVYRVGLAPAPAVPPEPVAVTDTGGRFEIAMNWRMIARNGGAKVPVPQLQWPILVVAPGFDARFARLAATEPVPIVLARAAAPIEGRVVDPQGKAVAGARLVGVTLLTPEVDPAPTQTVAQWISGIPLDDPPPVNRRREGRREPRLGWAKGRGRHALTEGLEPIATGPELAVVVPSPIVADADGRFTITGVGQNQVLSAWIEGPGIVTQRVLLTTERLDESITVRSSWRWQDKHGMVPPHIRMHSVVSTGYELAVVIHGGKFTHSAGFGRSIAGFLRDADSGVPLGGVEIRLDPQENRDNLFFGDLPPWTIRTTSDEAGSYRLAGLRGDSGLKLTVHLSPEAPWIAEDRRVSVGKADPAAPPVLTDILLKRGVWVSGRICDGATGVPYRGYVRMLPFADNPHVRRSDGSFEIPNPATSTDESGRYRLLAYPGPGILAAATESQDRFQRGLGIEAVPGHRLLTDRVIDTVPQRFSPQTWSRIVPLDAPLGSGPLVVDLPVLRAQIRTGVVLDPEGHPVTSGVVAFNLLYPQDVSLEDERFTVQNLTPGRLRRVIFRQEAQQRIAVLEIPDGAGPPLSVTLRPWGRAKIQVIDSGKTLLPRLSYRFHDTGDDLLFEESIPPWRMRRDVTDLPDHRHEVFGLATGVGYDLNWGWNEAPRSPVTSGSNRERPSTWGRSGSRSLPTPIGPER